MGIIFFLACTKNSHSSNVFLFQTYKRDGSDLHMVHKIGLVEALCGFQFTLKHLDARQIVVKYPAGKVIEPGERPLEMMSLQPFSVMV